MLNYRKKSIERNIFQLAAFFKPLQFNVFFLNKIILWWVNQCCGAGAGGAAIILGPGVGAKNKF